MYPSEYMQIQRKRDAVIRYKLLEFVDKNELLFRQNAASNINVEHQYLILYLTI